MRERATRKPPQQRRSRKTTDMLLRVGLRRLERDGIEGLSMSDVAAEADSSIGALYFRFGDKDQFVGAILAQALAESRDDMAALLDSAETENWPLGQIVETWVGGLIDVVRKRRPLLRIVVRQALASPEAILPVLSFVVDVRERLVAILTRSGQFRDKADAQRRLRIAAQIVHGTLMTMIIGQPKPLALDDDASKEQLALAVLRYLGIEPARVRRAARHRR
jgi:AcrR family transcriptional regulator